MAGKIYYIPGDQAPASDLVLEAARGRVNVEVGGAAMTPADATTLILGPGVDPTEALRRVAALTFIQLTTCDNRFLSALEMDKMAVHVATISPAVVDEVSSHTVGLAIAATQVESLAGRLEPSEIARLAQDVSSFFGKQVGIVGLGEVGTAVARRLAQTGARLVYSELRTASRQHTAGLGIRRSTQDLLLTKSDVIFVTARWGPTANPLIGSRELRLPDPGAVIVNAADRRLVDVPALRAVLSTGQLKGAGLGTNLSEDIVNLPNVVFSPLEMNAQTSQPAAELVVSNLERLANDEPVRGQAEPIDFPPAGDPSFWSSRLYPHRAG